MSKFEFLDSLEEIIVEKFDILNDCYSRDMAREVIGTMNGAIEQENEVRYLLIDGETGQLESRRLFEEYQEAVDEIKAKNLTHCQVATLIVDG